MLRPGALGDTVLMCAALRALRERFPGAHVELAGNLRAGLLLRDTGLVDEVTSFDSSDVTLLFGPAPRLSQRWRAVRVAIIWLASPSRLAAIFRSGGAGAVVAAHPEPERGGVHVADHLTATLMPLGIGAGPARRTALLAGLASAQGSHSQRTPREALLHPGSGSARKNWPAAAFAALARHLSGTGWRVSLLHGPADDDAVAELRHLLADLDIAFVRPSNLHELCRELTRVGLVVGNDSGVSHLSAQLGVPTLAIFGATDPARWGPRGPRVEIVGGSLGDWPSPSRVMAALHEIVA